MNDTIESEPMARPGIKKDSISLTLTKARLDEIKRLAAEQEISVSMFIDRLIKEHVEKKPAKPAKAS